MKHLKLDIYDTENACTDSINDKRKQEINLKKVRKPLKKLEIFKKATSRLKKNHIVLKNFICHQLVTQKNK